MRALLFPRRRCRFLWRSNHRARVRRDRHRRQRGRGSRRHAASPRLPGDPAHGAVGLHAAERPRVVLLVRRRSGAGLSRSVRLHGGPHLREGTPLLGPHLSDSARRRSSVHARGGLPAVRFGVRDSLRLWWHRVPLQGPAGRPSLPDAVAQLGDQVRGRGRQLRLHDLSARLGRRGAGRLRGRLQVWALAVASHPRGPVTGAALLT